MTRDDIITLVSLRCGDRDDLTAKCLAELPALQEAFEGNEWLPWFLETDLALADSSLPAGSGSIALPADFLLEVNDQKLTLVRADGTKKRLRKLGLDQMRNRYVETGEPAAYCLSGDRIYFAPIPEDSYTLEWRYYGKAPSIAASAGETLWTKHASDVVLAALGAVLAGRHLQNANLEASFAADLSRAQARLYNKHTQLEEENKESYMGD